MVFSVFDVCFFHGHQMEKQISLKTNIAYVLQEKGIIVVIGMLY